MTAMTMASNGQPDPPSTTQATSEMTIAANSR